MLNEEGAILLESSGLEFCSLSGGRDAFVFLRHKSHQGERSIGRTSLVSCHIGHYGGQEDLVKRR